VVRLERGALFRGAAVLPSAAGYLVQFYFLFFYFFLFFLYFVWNCEFINCASLHTKKIKKIKILCVGCELVCTLSCVQILLLVCCNFLIWVVLVEVERYLLYVSAYLVRV